MALSLPIFMGSDHAGFHLKSYIKACLVEKGFDVTDLGCSNTDPVDYPDIAKLVAPKLEHQEKAFGILVCGSGVGISMAANRFSYIRAALCRCPFEARLSREHNNANVLCLGGRILGEGLAFAIVEEFLKTPFVGGRHQKRVEKLGSVLT